MVVQEEKSAEEKTNDTFSLQDLRFKQLLNVGKEATMKYTENEIDGWLFGKTSIDSDLNLLGLEGQNWFGIIDMKTRKQYLRLTEIHRDIHGMRDKHIVL